MLVGIISGTYSTIFIAAAIAIMWQGRKPIKGQVAAADNAESRKPAPSHREAPARRVRECSQPRFCSAIVQGLTEFLPVSSSAHLILARAFFGWEVPADFGLAFDVALHIGTLAAILTFFRREIAAMVAALPAVLSPARRCLGRLAQRIVVGTVPVVVVGLLFNDFIEQTLRTPARGRRGAGGRRGRDVRRRTRWAPRSARRSR